MEKIKRSRKLREWYPNAMYHITSRGNRRNDIFRDDEDYQVYITIVKEAIEFLENQYEIISYCLMTNHVHL
ncbi:MAG: transposase [Clostridium sp.]|uniref:transposase n=1 Tax=Clostridium sp. TaxID=1506 RepID=UPI003D6D0265